MTIARLDDPAVYHADRIAIRLPYRGSMELKTARLTLLIDPNKKAAFERLCAQQDLTPSQVVRKLIRDYLAEHGVAYQPAGKAGQAEDEDESGKTAGRPKASASAKTRNVSSQRRPKG